MLVVENLFAGYGMAPVLKGVSFNVKKGEFITLIGTNGAGKTSTLNSLMGMLKISSGKIKWNDQDITSWKPHQIVSSGICLIPEGRQLFSNMTVYENLQMGFLGNKNQSKTNFNDNLERVYSIFSRIQERTKQLAGSLSGGEQQMVAIARGLMAQPEILLLDEPSLGLSPIMVQHMAEIISSLHKENQTILLVEQNVGLALKLADYAYVLENGNIIQSGNSQDLLNSDDIRKAYLGV